VATREKTVPNAAPRESPRNAAAELAEAAAALRAERLALAAERERIRRSRRRALVLVGLAFSVPLHLAIAIWLMNVLWVRPGASPAGEEVTFEFAVLEQPSLEEVPTAEIPDADAPEVTEPTETVEAMVLEPIDPQVGGEGVGSGSLDAGGSGLTGEGGSPGGGGGLGPGGGGGGTSFFGIGGKGQRFAYIVDISGSMSAGERMPTAINELKRSIAALPDFASVFVCLYANDPVPMPVGEGWVRARPANVARINEWLDRQRPGGGTQPGGAFVLAFQLNPPPDVIFFLTDGEIPEQTPDAVLALNAQQKRRKVVVHTVAFSPDASQDSLRRIARESEGTFRFVPVSNAGSFPGLIP
jgi:hypothetical protein